MYQNLALRWPGSDAAGWAFGKHFVDKFVLSNDSVSVEIELFSHACCFLIRNEKASALHQHSDVVFSDHAATRKIHKTERSIDIEEWVATELLSERLSGSFDSQVCA